MNNSKATRNIKVIAINDGNNPGFDIYLDFSGKREFLIHHRHNGLLYQLLSNGIRLDELRRRKPLSADSRSRCKRSNQREQSERMENMVTHLLNMIDANILERSESQKITKHQTLTSSLASRKSEYEYLDEVRFVA